MSALAKALTLDGAEEKKEGKALDNMSSLASELNVITSTTATTTDPSGESTTTTTTATATAHPGLPNAEVEITSSVVEENEQGTVRVRNKRKHFPLF